MTIPAQFLDQLRDRTSLVALIGKSIPLKKNGNEHAACCPFHSEKSPSFTVSEAKGFYHCFGCGAHGDAIRWMTDHQGLQFIDAVKELAAAAGMDVPAADPRQAERDKRRERDTEVMAKAAAWYAAALAGTEFKSNDALQYLYGRGITDSEISKFQIGFAPASRMGDRPHAASFGSPEEVTRLGLAVKSPDDPSRVFDFFRRRITIPIHDARGRVVGFGGRIVGDGKPKYLNSPDTPIFDKGRSLFNLHRASAKARANDRLIVVEGYMDVIGMESVGVTETVAPNGTAMTEAQMGLCWKLVDQPILCFDADPAGRKAALRAAARALPLLVPGKGLRFVSPPDGQDPDDVARKGGVEAVSAMLASPMSISDLIWADAMAQMKDAGPDQVAGVRRATRQLLETIKDPDVAEAYMSDMTERFRVYNARRATVHRPAQSPARRAVADALQDGILKGVVRHIDRIHIMGEDLAKVVWNCEDVRAVMDALVWTALEGHLDRSNFVEVLEQRGLGERYRVVMARDTLRLPFTVGTADEKSFRALLDTIRAQRAN